MTSFRLFIFEKNDVNVPSKSNKQENFFFKLVSDEIVGSGSASGSTPKCHGSGTLDSTFKKSSGLSFEQIWVFSTGVGLTEASLVNFQQNPW